MGAIKERVNEVIVKHGTYNLFELATAMRIAILYEDLGKILGYYSKVCRIPIIHINESLSYEKQLFTCCHELGHAILHPDANTPFLKSYTYYSTDKMEIEANLFAVELLLHQGGDNTITVREAIENYGIPKQLLLKNFYA